MDSFLPRMIIALLVFVVFPLAAVQGAVDFSDEYVSSYSLISNSVSDSLTNYQYNNAVGSIMPLKSVGVRRSEYFFIDTNLSDYAELVRSVQSGVADDVDFLIIPVRADEDGIAKITRVLAASPVKIDTLHIFSHAEPGTLLLGSKRIESATLEQPYVYSQLHGTWRAALAEQADILFYGCELAAGEEGSGFIHRFSRISGADVGASDDLTGNAGLGGDWELEATVGHVEVAALHALSYPYTLGTTEISGRIKKDVQGDADIDDANDLGIPGVHVYLYRDINGNNLPDNSDVHYATAVTDANGDYAFSDNILTYTRATLPNGTYWLVAEVAGIDTLGATLEQTYGGTGAMIDPDSDSSTEGTYRSSAGSAFGARRMDTYD
ncbi:MAG: DUF4347 domain-containing protein, partial [Candidatus Electrothrix sp. AX5]|nr:DUF4347 domain-containing protein [Candidatus Electrothrix sp. AX5]